MAISYLSSPIKSAPYVLPVNLDLMGKVLNFKETNFKQNASKIQSSIDTIQSTDLIKDEDKQYLTEKINNLTNGLNNLGGVDLGDINIANQLNQITSDVYSDNDLLESITSTQKVRKLQSTYEKMQSDPKLKGSFATQNYAYDMQDVNAWLSNGERTTSGKGYSGASTPTPYSDLDKAAIESAKLVKSNYTKSSVKDGVYIHNVTKEEVNAEDIKSQVRNTLLQNPMYQTQAKINSWYLRPNVTGDEIKTEFTTKINSTLTTLQKDYDSYKKTYDFATPDQQLQMSENLKIKKNNVDSYSKIYKDATAKPSTHYEEQKDAYRTNLYVENMTDHLAASMSYTKFTDEAKADMAQLGLLKMQLEAQEKGLDMVTDVSNPLGYSFVKNANFVPASAKSKSSKAGASTTPDGFNLNEQGQLINNINTDEHTAWTDEKSTEVILKKQDEKQQIFINVLQTLANHNPELVKMLGKDMSIAALSDKYRGLNDPARFEIEDIKDAANNKIMSRAQTEYLTKLYKSYEAVISGGTPELQLTPDILDDFTKIKNLNKEIDTYTDLRNKSMGTRIDRNNAGLIIKNEDGKLELKDKPIIVSKRADGAVYTDENDYYMTEMAKYGVPGLVGAFGNRLNRAAAEVSGVLTDKNILSVYERDGKYFPADGKDHSYTFTSGVKGKPNTGQNLGITVPKEGISKEALQKYMQTPWTTAGSLSNELQELKIFKTPSHYEADRGITDKTLSIKDPKAYDALNKTLNYFNYAFPQGTDAQEKTGVLNRLKIGILKEAELGSSDIRDSKGNTNKLSFGTENITNSYISRIGTSSDDPTKIEAEITMVENKKGGLESRKIYKVLSQTDLASVGISLPPQEIMLDQLAIDINGRTLPEVIRPSISAKDNMLAVPMAIVETKQGSGMYAPQIQIPINGVMTWTTFTGVTDNLNTQDLTGTSPLEAKDLFSKYITALYSQGIKSNQQFYNHILPTKK
jgi:hypothetical protein